MSMILDGSNGVTFNDSSLQGAAASPYVLKNRIINGDMRIDQRNAGASVNQSTSLQYVVDRWNIYGSVATKFSAQQNAGSVTPPAGFSNYLGITSLSAYTVGAAEFFYLQQMIEGFNTADLNLGTYHSNAKFLPGADTNHYVRYLTSLDGLEMSGYSGVMFSTLGGTERVRIGGGGELKITGGGGSNTAFSLYDGGSRRCFFIPSQYYGYMWGCQIVSNGGKMWSFGNDNGSEVGTIVINAGGVAYNTTSDYRLKEDLRDFNGLEKVSAIKVYDFKWKNLDERTNGVLAHELAEVLPYAVSGVKDALNHEGNIEAQSVDYSKLTPVLVKAIQELKSQNDALQARIETLEQK